MRVALLSAFLLAAPAALIADSGLPVYEFAGGDPLRQSLDGFQFNALFPPDGWAPPVLTVLLGDGSTCAASLADTSRSEWPGCCGEAALVRRARYQLNPWCPRTGIKLLLPDTAEILTLIDLHSADRGLPPGRYVSKKAVQPAVFRPSAGPDFMSIRWVKQSGEIALLVNGEFTGIRMSNCRSVMNGRRVFLYCPAEGDPEDYRRLDWYFYYHDNELVYARPDRSRLPGVSGAFDRVRPDPVAIYDWRGQDTVAFRPGFSIRRNGSEWSFERRRPLKVYGDCDCVELE